ncbi:TetR/AcrR family transcriptional regulator [Undibacterium sp.]|jgi:AcrR family transcriptional regulator|uniref:TetR/AcrR family transcriptional regulator n=1 Tax=Undibacterium sp. TaxID=1914977 RepID=UPI002CAE809D|nr:TetR/AcrR family transcriptional regulator [Undibacterium sp.]HTD03602.1 TetR/AcrR family transcriptional regulator [Undibacterium sp.]
MNTAISPIQGRQKVATAGSDEKRERILKAAEALFFEQGYVSTTMDQIVQVLGVTKPFVYYYFRNKQEIFETLSWRPTLECLSAMDFADDDPRAAHEKIADGIQRLIRATISHYPSAFFGYREPQVYSAKYKEKLNKLAHHFYDRLCALLEEGRRDGMLDFNETKITALAACSLPGFLYTWYRPDGRLDQEQMVQELSQLAWRVLGLRSSR